MRLLLKGEKVSYHGKFINFDNVGLPWKPVRGYSVTVAQHVRESAPDSGPRAALLDLRAGAGGPDGCKP